MYDAIVIGAGPAGMMAAAEAARAGAKVLILERNARIGRKLAITGKGRCNVTNASGIREMPEQIISNPRFILSALHRFTNRDLMERMEELGVPLKVERGERVFPVSDKAMDIVDALKYDLEQHKVTIHCNTRVKQIVPKDDLWHVQTEHGSFEAKNVVVATGGVSYPATGSTGDGYRFAKENAHTVTEPKQGLVPLTVSEGWVRKMQGLSLRNVSVKLYHQEHLIHEEFGEMLFTHFGVSGPVILSLSSRLQHYLREKKVGFHQITLHLDLKPALTEEVLDKRMLRDFEKHFRKQLSGAMVDLLPKRLISAVLEQAGLSETLKVSEITKEQRLQLVRCLKNLTCTITGCRPMTEAIITMGGVDVHQIDPKTMESKICPGLFFAGEVLDIDALTGGYNLQIAFSTGAAAGRSIKVYEK